MQATVAPDDNSQATGSRKMPDEDYADRGGGRVDGTPSSLVAGGQIILLFGMNPLRTVLGLGVLWVAASVSGLAVETAKTGVTLPPPVPGLPIGWCIRAKPEAFADAKSAGFEYVELALQDVLGLSDDEFARLAAQLQATGVPARSGYNPIPKEIALVGPQVEPAKQDEHLHRLLERAAYLKLRYIVFNSGASWRIPEGFPPAQAFDQLVDFSRRFATAAAKQGITVLVEPLRSTDSNQITTIAEAWKLMQAVNHPQFEMMVDYSFLRIQKDDVPALTKVGRHLRDVHISNPANHRTYPMSGDESDYAEFFRVLKAIGYRDGISVHGGTTAFASDAARAITFLRGNAREIAEPTK